MNVYPIPHGHVSHLENGKTDLNCTLYGLNCNFNPSKPCLRVSSINMVSLNIAFVPRHDLYHINIILKYERLSHSNITNIRNIRPLVTLKINTQD